MLFRSPYIEAILASTAKNEATAAKAAKVDTLPMTYGKTFAVIKETLNALSPPENGEIVYVSEGANTMDISRSVFNVEHPRLRLDAGTYATMGVGLGYAIAAHCAYNLPNPQAASGPSSSRKKIVCLEGDSAFGFSMPEIETMARYCMDILVFVVNNGGVYHGDSADSDAWLALQDKTTQGAAGGLRSTSLGWEVGYEKMAEMCGGKGYLVRTPEELRRATEEGYKATVPVVINIIIEAGQAKKLVSVNPFRWLCAVEIQAHAVDRAILTRYRNLRGRRVRRRRLRMPSYECECFNLYSFWKAMYIQFDTFYGSVHQCLAPFAARAAKCMNSHRLDQRKRYSSIISFQEPGIQGISFLIILLSSPFTPL